MQNLKKIFLHNTIHFILGTLPFFLAWILTCIFPGDNITKYVLLFIYIISIAILYYPIYVNINILRDLKKDKTKTIYAQIEINPGWKNAAFGIKKKYLHEIFTKDYHNIFDIYYKQNKKTLFLEMYILNSNLKKTNFNKFFNVYYDGKNEIISKKSNKIAARITYYEKSKIIKDIVFFEINNT